MKNLESSKVRFGLVVLILILGSACGRSPEKKQRAIGLGSATEGGGSDGSTQSPTGSRWREVTGARLNCRISSDPLHWLVVEKGARLLILEAKDADSAFAPLFFDQLPFVKTWVEQSRATAQAISSLPVVSDAWELTSDVEPSSRRSEITQTGRIQLKTRSKLEGKRWVTYHWDLVLRIFNASQFELSFQNYSFDNIGIFALVSSETITRSSECEKY